MLGSDHKFRIRKGVPADAAALAVLFRETWELTYRAIIPAVHLETLIRRRNEDAWRLALGASEGILVLEVLGVIAGYASFGAARGRGRSAYRGEIYELYLAPVYQGLGLGEHLFEATRSALDQRRLSGLIVWALADNLPALSFYWARGGRPIARVTDRMAGVPLPKVAYGWT
ncbi:MAG TPA: GNAT family N-acetyltransferase [Hyphomicrobiaceae bacterium]|nr:GNAT family N-acetyltransferase [Hyphomicrobiaceae bacterium]